ncbi:MAG: TrpR YerC/YecD [Clostridia bacterium]|nr:TrpR YerC/YecD [Clostridia bacterium]
MDLKEKNPDKENLYKAILSLNTMEECDKFFDDICTIKEIIDLSLRLKVAKLLREKVSYTDIEKITGASSATISRIGRCVNYGSGGYGIVLDRLEE